MNFEPIRWNGPGPADGLPQAGWRWLTQALEMPALLATPARPLRDIALPPPRLTDAARDRFIALLGAQQVCCDPATRLAHGGDGIIAVLRKRMGELQQLPDAVLCPRTADDVPTLLAACAELGVTIGGGDARPGVALDLSKLSRVRLDAVSGLAEVEAGIGAAELARQLAAGGMALETPDFTELGGFIIAHRGLPWLAGVQAATPQGMTAALGDLLAGSRGAFGIITSATLRVHALAATPQPCRYLFADFAAGLAAIREAVKSGIGICGLRLSDAGATQFARGLARAGQGFDLMRRLRDIYLEVRRFDSRACDLSITFADAAGRKRFDVLVRRLGAMALGAQAIAADFAPLLERGVNADTLQASVSWSRLPALYAATRHALDQAMRAHAPLPGAHGLVLAQVSGARADGADITFTCIYPRKLDDALAQAQAIHQAGLDCVSPPPDAPSRLAMRATKQALDPENILGPLL